MIETPDFTALARQYLDLWEDQLAAMAADPALGEQSARFIEAMGREAIANPMATAQMAAMVQQFMTLAGLAAGGKPDNGDASEGAGAPAPNRPAPAAAASGDGTQQLAELASRLAAVEARLDRLDAGTGGARRRAKPPAGKRRSAKAAGGAAAKRPRSKRD